MVHTESNLWDSTTTNRLPIEQLNAAETADLVIVGGGYTGCSAALHARQLGMDVCLLEAAEVGHGGSGRNVGLVNAGLWTPPTDVENQIGQGPGQRLNTLLAGGPDLVFSLIDDHEIKCEAVRSGTLHCAHSKSAMNNLRSRFGQLCDHDAPVSLYDTGETATRTGSPAFHGSLFDPRAGTVQPLAYCHGLAIAAARAGARIYQGSGVASIERRNATWSVRTQEGSVNARYLLVSTNAYHDSCAGVPSPESTIVSYSQFATAPLAPEYLKKVLPGKEGCWDTATVMSSFRLDAGGRLVIGTMGSLDHAASGIHKHWARKKLGRLFPDQKSAPFEFSWSGRIAMTRDHLPKILGLADSGYCVFGYSGRGIGPGTVFGKTAAEALASGSNAPLPVSPTITYLESGKKWRSVWFEAGTLLIHGLEGIGTG